MMWLEELKKRKTHTPTHQPNKYITLGHMQKSFIVEGARGLYSQCQLELEGYYALSTSALGRGMGESQHRKGTGWEEKGNRGACT